MAVPLLQACHLCCERDERMLFSGLDFSILPGTLTRIEGPNGAGKTTLLRMLAGLSLAYEGEILWRGEPLRHVREDYQRHLLYLGHKPAVKALLTPLENLQALLSPRQPVTTGEMLRALELVGLRGFEDVPCQQLSAGQQRRVALARLYLSKEPVWLLDEAFTAIDRAGVLALESLLLARAAAGGAVVMTTHHEFAAERVQRILLKPDARAEVLMHAAA